MGLGIVPDNDQPPGSTPPHFDQIGSRNFPFFYNGLPTEQGYALTYNHQRGAVPNHLGWRTRPLHIYPLTGLSGTTAAPSATDLANAFATSAAHLVRIGRRLHNLRQQGVNIPASEIAEYTSGKLSLARDLSQTCQENRSTRIPIPVELGITFRDSANRDCLVPIDVPAHMAGLGALPALLAIPAAKVLIPWLGAVIIAAIGAVAVGPSLWASARSLNVTSAAQDARTEVCEGYGTPAEKERCLNGAAEERRRDAEPQDQNDPLEKFGSYLKWGAAIALAAVVGPPLLAAISKATSKA